MALHVVVATVEDASVVCNVIEYVPGETFIVCVVEVLPLPHRKPNGTTPSDAEAFHAIAVADGVPVHEVVSADAEPANAINARSTIPASTVPLCCNVIR